MTVEPIRDIVIVGGGTAGWMAAAILGKALGTNDRTITLIESQEIGTVGVGEATIPTIMHFNSILGISEDEFVRETNATFKLGIDFVGWRQIGSRYFHPFGLFGAAITGGVGFMNYWLRWVQSGGDPDCSHFSAEAEAASHGKFGRTGTDRNLPRINYAYQFDAATYAAYLRSYSKSYGVVRREGRIIDFEQNGESGYIEAVKLADGTRIAGDFFIDCSGFRGLLIDGAFGVAFDDWSKWLPNNRAAAVPCEVVEAPTPFTRSTAREAGWQWRIPLQHRTGNGYVFCDAHISEGEAARQLMERLDGKALADPKILRFTAGKRRVGWAKNCLAIGLSSGFLEPLESTSIHLIQAGLMKLLELFPHREVNPVLIDQYNREMDRLYDHVRDFIIAHYKVTEREDTPFWRYCRNMEIPDSLAAKLALFEERGEAHWVPGDLFSETSWFAVLYGQGMTPKSYHPAAATMSEEHLQSTMARIRRAIDQRVEMLPSHADFIKNCCASKNASMVP
jgi:tryptophan halogenase